MIHMTDGYSHDHDCDCTDGGLTRRGFAGGCGATLAFALAGTTPEAVTGTSTNDNSAIARLLANKPDDWGRFGEEDELGRLNLLGSEEAFDGMRAVTKRGKKRVERFTLQLSQTGEVINPDSDEDETTTDTGDPAFPPRTPARRDNTTRVDPDPAAGGMKFVDDKFVTDAFLQGTTHVDALGHAWYGEEIYNGFSARTTETEKTFDTPLLGTQNDDALSSTNEDDEDQLEPVETTRGLSRSGIENVGDRGVAGRGVLLDVGRALGDSDENYRLPLGYEVTYEDLMKTADQQGTEIRDRDILLVRTGAIERTRDPDAEWAPLNEPGIVYSDDLYDFVYERDIPYIGADNLAVEKVVQVIDVDEDPETDPKAIVIPLHGAFLRDLGVQLNEILDLRELSRACAADGIYEFLFTAAPLNVERATGSPANPLVLKATGGGKGRKSENGPE